ncbi:FtsW/RodA/SpoVE family cell cycle protein [Thiorhodovibrio frisius]|uniref:Bacterial cell division membrane protein n=1 Tax=Thiorhodovibrio frisius TaxID=631362 RepID=H8YYZ9_9GAMM|nr:FtsW/RodA/SpoVE family cell cycle protein [Thiorhodovibrio frisius]EIC21926.1 bacterial cell division membrane protein [Thiorhodovibrio frisius]WPL24215.1 Cell division protein FtsW [Thiorhodovibrio frisius]
MTAANPTSWQETWTARAPERHWLLLCGFAVSVGFLLIFGAQRSVERLIEARDLLPLALYVPSLIVVHLTLVAVRFRGDQLLVAAVALLSGLGILMHYRLGAFAADTLAGALRQYALYPACMGAMLLVTLAAMRGRYRHLAASPWLWALVSLGLLAALVVTGQRYRGAIYAAGFLTPSEFLKLSVVLYLAAFIAARAAALGAWRYGVLPPARALLPLVAVWLVLCALLLWQRDLGMVAILNVVLLLLLTLGSGRIGYFLLGLAVAVGGSLILLRFFSHSARRIDAWLNPFTDPTGASWQLLQGLSGMYSGGLWGQGFGAGNPEYIPIAASDFVYAVVGEELGFFGSVLVVLFFLLLFQRGFAIALRCRGLFARLLAAGLTAVLAVQTFLNIGGVTKLIPLTGLTLPFISQGGSSLLASLMAVGLLLAISDGEPKGRGRTKRRKA